MALLRPGRALPSPVSARAASPARDDARLHPTGFAVPRLSMLQKTTWLLPATAAFVVAAAAAHAGPGTPSPAAHRAGVYLTRAARQAKRHVPDDPAPTAPAKYYGGR